jgi:hypothetical protein
MKTNKKVNKEMIEKAQELSRAGFNNKQIYEVLNISKALFYRSIDLIDPIKDARKELRQNISQSLINNAVDLNNPTVQIFLAKRLKLFDDTFDSISIKKSDDVLKVVADIFKAVSTNTISEDKSKQLLAILDTYIKAYEMNELEKRITELEAQN